MLNARASLNLLLNTIKDADVALLAEPDQPQTIPCLRVEWLSAEVPRGLNRFARAVRVHLKARGEGTYGAEARMNRLLSGLGLGNQASIAAHPLFDYASNPSSPPQRGTFTVERSGRGVDVVPAPADDPTLRHLVLNLVVVYQ